ncbi:MAG TPA: S-layer glycoprotein N-glycosyltransferase AglJ [Methanotrichaceae archaeon]|nr:S-layer glycoprotein N-glycosyltransferase AglJ [Methanotrichaceae archaeon]HQJ28483.1 S-layer glycoprotein N-glycosyltransferase AglJ [Methanotrichaceae archaeon]
MNREDVCILIPTLNEGGSIEAVVKGFLDLGFPHILVVDGHSTDGTADLARRAGAEVIMQSGSGKGQAVKEAFDRADSKYIVLVDGDGTYLPQEVDLLLDPLEKGVADHVVGNRFGRLTGGALKRFNLFGNRLINLFFGMMYGVELQDLLSGYRAFTQEGVRCLNLSMTGFEIESEITIESVKKGLRIAEVPITYLPRAGGTKTKLNPVRDGSKIVLTIYRMAKTQNPLFYFGLMGSIFGAAGFLMGVYVLMDWLSGRVEHLPLTILTAIFIIVGFQLFILGIQGDMMASMHREVLREMRRKKR